MKLFISLFWDTFYLLLAPFTKYFVLSTRRCVKALVKRSFNTWCWVYATRSRGHNGLFIRCTALQAARFLLSNARGVCISILKNGLHHVVGRDKIESVLFYIMTNFNQQVFSNISELLPLGYHLNLQLCCKQNLYPSSDITTKYQVPI